MQEYRNNIRGFLERDEVVVYSDELTNEYLNFLRSIMTNVASDFFSPRLINQYNLKKNDFIVAIDGEDLDLALIGHRETTSQCRDFRFF